MPLRRRRAETLGLWDATAMAIGGMVGGGIFTVLGVAVSLAGHLAFGCFLIGAVLAALTARSFAVLAKGSGRSGGLFDYLRDAGHPELAALVSWLLCLGYVLALAVYSFTFGHYVADLGGFGPLGADVAAVSVLAVFLAINLRGVALSATSEDLIVAAKLLVLGGVAAIGLTRFDADRFRPLANEGGSGVLLGAAAIFVAYEGFELLSFDYDDLRDPARTYPRATLISVSVVSALYVLVTIGSQSLVADRLLVEQKEIAFAEVGRAALGPSGRWVAALAAILATSSAVHATLFSTARLVRQISHAGELPHWFGLQRRGLPVNALVVLAVAGALAGLLPNLELILGFASLAFLCVFVVVNLLALRTTGRRAAAWSPVLAASGCLGAIGLLLYELGTENPLSLVAIAATALVVAAIRWAFVRRRAARTDR
ncbi:MAG: APC family permease [Acidimicrobiia bacterium]